LPTKTDKTKPEDEADLIDREVGARVRMARRARNMSQTELGSVLGVTFQQVQKYERGANRISSSALVLISRALEVSPMELLGQNEKSSKTGLDWEFLSVEGGDDLLRSYRRISSPKLRKLLLDLARELSSS
jgi:transcriptional regulator with XRE-family HTH domain